MPRRRIIYADVKGKIQKKTKNKKQKKQKTIVYCSYLLMNQMWINYVHSYILKFVLEKSLTWIFKSEYCYVP